MTVFAFEELFALERVDVEVNPEKSVTTCCAHWASGDLSKLAPEVVRDCILWFIVHYDVFHNVPDRYLVAGCLLYYFQDVDELPKENAILILEVLLGESSCF